MSGRFRAVAAAAVALLLVSLPAAGLAEALGQETQQPSIKPAAAAPELEAPAAPRPAKERMAVYVILAWVWFSIAVLLGLLRMRVREADRVHRMGFHRAAEKSPGGPGH